MSVSEAAATLQVSRQTIMRMIKDGRLTPLDPPKPYRKRRVLRFDRATVEQMAAS